MSRAPVQIIITSFTWRVLVTEKNIRWVRGRRDPLRKIPLSIRRADGATHLCFHHMHRNATQSQELERISLPKQRGMSTEIKLIDNASNMEVEGGTQVSVQHRDKTQCSGHDNEVIWASQKGRRPPSTKWTTSRENNADAKKDDGTSQRYVSTLGVHAQCRGRSLSRESKVRSFIVKGRPPQVVEDSLLREEAGPRQLTSSAGNHWHVS